MKAEFTAIYETDANGTIMASVAELPSVVAGGQTREEAQARLAKKLQLFLEAARLESLGRSGPATDVEGIVVETGPLAEAVHWARENCVARADAEFWLTLLQQGRIDHLPPLRFLDTDAIQPIQIEGRPISEEIIEARG